jgi:hypothetical protein
MSIGIGIGMGIGGASPNTPLVTGWFAIDAGCAFTLPSNPYTDFLEGMPYKTGDYIETRIAGPYTGKRILLGTLVTSLPSPATFIIVQDGSLAYNACQI